MSKPRSAAEPPPLSVVVPLGPGETAWRELMADLEALPAGSEVILVAAAGDLQDTTVQRSTVPARRWIQAPAGRASQLNAGVAAARHPLLCLLHADSRLPAGSLRRLADSLPGRNELAYFDLRFTDGPALMWLNTLGAWIRSRWLGMPFGDQGFVLDRRDFHRLGGFDPQLACGEDHALVWRARRSGLRLKALRAPILTSARKYARDGWWTTTARHLTLTWRQARRFRRDKDPR